MKGTNPDVQPEKLLILEPSNTTFRWVAPNSPIHLTSGGHQTHFNVIARLAFPRTNPDSYIVFYQKSKKGKFGESIGMIVSLEGLSKDVRSAVAELLRRSYAIPKIQSFRKIKATRNIARFDVTTDRGPCTFEVKNIYKNIESSVSGRVTFVDIEKNRYEVPDFSQLDAESQRLLHAFV